MRVFLTSLLLAITLFFLACTSEKDIELAEQYRLDLQYYQNAVQFSSLNMHEEAKGSCDQTIHLKSECYTTYVQDLIAKGVQPQTESCNTIKPAEKMGMTMNAFRLVYPDIDKDLKKELKEKMNPSEQRINALTQIKEECYRAQ